MPVSRKYHPECRSRVQLAIQFNATTQQADEAARNGKTKSNAGFSFPAGRSPVKLLPKFNSGYPMMGVVEPMIVFTIMVGSLLALNKLNKA